MTTDLLVLGSGIAGLSAAIRAARAGLRVAVVTKSELATSATRYAQGGVAAALDEPDSTELHQTDTVGTQRGRYDYLNFLKRRTDLEHLAGKEFERSLREDRRRMRAYVLRLHDRRLFSAIDLYSSLYNCLPETLLAADGPEPGPDPR